mmetsp:Transcript_24518/g.41976  ORF Transcript_24518/g.41976 Transcript_24518/m.41976 type:complete len:270 (+) Transcript_24518:508-1317(+)
MDLPSHGPRTPRVEQQSRPLAGGTQRIQRFGRGRTQLGSRTRFLLSKPSQFQLWRTGRGHPKATERLSSPIEGTSGVESEEHRGHATISGQVPRTAKSISHGIQARRHHGRIGAVGGGVQPDGRERVRTGSGLRRRSGGTPEGAHGKVGQRHREDPGQVAVGHVVRLAVRDGHDQRHTGGEGGDETGGRPSRQRGLGRCRAELRGDQESRAGLVRYQHQQGRHVHHEEFHDHRPGSEQRVLPTFARINGYRGSRRTGEVTLRHASEFTQ